MLMSKALAWFESLSASLQDLPEWETLSEDQFLAIWSICSGDYRVVTLLGRAGSGKTYVVKFARTLLKALGCEVRVVGSTGVASQNAGGESTLNKFVGIGTGDVLPRGLEDDLPPDWRNKRMPLLKAAQRASANFAGSDRRKETVIIIDEVSMVSSENLLLTYQVIAEVLKGRKFRFVCVGDMRQLLAVDAKPSITPPWKGYVSLPFERAKFNCAGSDETIEYGSMLKEGPFPIVNGSAQCPQGESWTSIQLSLIKNHRQKDSDGWFIDSLNAIGDGSDFNHPSVRALLKRVWVKDASGVYRNFLSKEPLEATRMEQALHVHNTNKEVQSRNAAALNAAKQAGKTARKYAAKVQEGTWTRNEILKEVSPLEPEFEIAEGMRFMVRINLNEALSNGTTGEVLRMERDRIQLKLDNGSIHWIEQCDVPLPKNSRGNPVGTFQGIPGVACHAMTPWKSQGLTLTSDLAYHLNNWNKTHGLMYVVCSRVKDPSNLFLLVENMRMLNNAIVCDPRVAEFIKSAESLTLSALQGEEVTMSSDPKHIETIQEGAAIAHVFELGGIQYALVFEGSQLIDTNIMENGDWSGKKLDPFITQMTQKVVAALNLPICVETPDASPVQESRVQEEVIETSEPESVAVQAPTVVLPIWSEDPEQPGFLCVRDYRVQWVDYVSEPKGAIEVDSDKCTIYVRDGIGGMFVKNPLEVGEMLASNDEVYAYFKENIHVVWFLPEDDNSTSVEESPTAPVQSVELPTEVQNIEPLKVQAEPAPEVINFKTPVNLSSPLPGQAGQVRIAKASDRKVRERLEAGDPCYVYCGREWAGLAAAVLENPYHIGRDGTVEEVIDLFSSEVLWPAIAGGGVISQILQKLAAKVAAGETIYLCCWCDHAALCHTREIKQVIEMLVRGEIALFQRA